MTFWVAVNTISVEVVEPAPFKAGFDNMSITEGVPIADLHALFSTQYILLYDIMIYHPIDYCDWPRTGVNGEILECN